MKERIPNGVARTKQSYSTAFVLQYKFGLLPKELQQSIPSSTRSNWKRRDISQIIGIEQEKEVDLDYLKLLLQHQRLLQIAKALYTLLVACMAIIESCSTAKERMQKCHREIGEAIKIASPVLGKKRCFKFFGITQGQWNYWKELPKICIDSLQNKCRKIHPLQLLPMEIATIKVYLENEFWRNWSLTSVYYQMMRDGKAFCALATFYKYAKLLGYQRKRPKHRKKKHERGLRANAPAEWLHLDVTLFRPLDNSKVYIYLLVDNFSRFILSATASTKYNAQTCLQNLKKGFSEYPNQLRKEEIRLLTDGGAEN